MEESLKASCQPGAMRLQQVGMGRLTGLAQGVLACSPKVILYASSKRFTVWEGRLLRTQNQIQREEPEREGSVAALRTAAFPCRGLTRKFTLHALHRAPSFCPPIRHHRTRLWLRVSSFVPWGVLQSHSPWSLRADMEGSSSDTFELWVQASSC